MLLEDILEALEYPLITQMVEAVGDNFKVRATLYYPVFTVTEEVRRVIGAQMGEEVADA